MPNPSELQRQVEYACKRGVRPGRKAFSHFEDYTPDEIEFMNAMQRFKDENRRPYPDCRDVLGVLRSLGYVKHLVT